MTTASPGLSLSRNYSRRCERDRSDTRTPGRIDRRSLCSARDGGQLRHPFRRLRWRHIPDLTSNREEVARWVATLHAPTPLDWLSMAVEGAGLLCLLVFSAYLYGRLRPAEAGRGWLASAALAGGLLSVAIKMSSLPPMLALFYRAHSGIDAQLATSLIDQNSFAFIETWAANGILLGAACAAGLRYRALPRWLAWPGAVVGLLLLAAAPVAFGPVYPVTLLFLVWMLVAGMALAIRPAGEVAQASTHVPSATIGDALSS